MIHLRRLEIKDAEGMHEWMNDSKVTEYFDLSETQKTMKSIQTFIKHCQIHQTSLHYAIVDESDTYLGTISLKNIHLKNKHAEYAIVLRKSAQGRGLGKQASELLIDKAFHELGLHKIYLNAITTNTIAIKLYEKLGFVRQGSFKDHLYLQGHYIDLYYYELLLGESL